MFSCSLFDRYERKNGEVPFPKAVDLVLGWEEVESQGWGSGDHRQGVASLAALAGVLS